jgi:5S rRNA maturation endonuclease (ribonuclease M5)
MGEQLMANHTLPQLAAQRFSAKQIEKGFHPEALHTYTDLEGNALYWRIRLKHSDGNKWIRPMYQDADGQFHLCEPPEIKSKPLYGLQYLARHPDAQVFIVEGEYPTDTLNQFFEKQNVTNNYITITSGSATSTDTVDWQPLARKHCIIWPDHDEPGENYALHVSAKLKNLGCSIELIEIANLNLPIGGDCVDWLRINTTATLGDLLNLRRPITSEENLPANESETISQLATFSPFKYDRKRIAIAKSMGIRPATLDNIVKAEKAVVQEASTPFITVEPWHEPIQPANLLTDIFNTIKRFIVCQDETATAATLWAAMTWFIDAIQVAPLAVITAPEKRCGKSQMLFLLSRLVNRPLVASNITSAALFRAIDAWQPTLLIDEADTFMRENEELRGLINCGHTRESAFTIRVVGDDHTPKQFFVWGAKALASIGKLPATLMDRSITLELRRKRPEETIERLRHAEPELFRVLAKKLARFAQDHFDTVRNAKPLLPDTLNDRAQDNWEPLLAIAEIAGEKWQQLARTAAIKLSDEAEQPRSIGVELLTDIYEIIETLRTDRISSADLITALCKDDEKSWSTYNRGHPITPRQISNRLREFGIMSQTIRVGTSTAKGYLFLQFADAFNRYVHPLSVTASQPALYNDFDVT